MEIEGQIQNSDNVDVIADFLRAAIGREWGSVNSSFGERVRHRKTDQTGPFGNYHVADIDVFGVSVAEDPKEAAEAIVDKGYGGRLLVAAANSRGMITVSGGEVSEIFVEGLRGSIFEVFGKGVVRALIRGEYEYETSAPVLAPDETARDGIRRIVSEAVDTDLRLLDSEGALARKIAMDLTDWAEARKQEADGPEVQTVTRDG